MAAEEAPKSAEVSGARARKFRKIPVFCVENHNDVLELLLPALARNYLPFQNNLLVHFDAHPDCCVSRQMPANTVFNRRVLLESLSIENWVIPLTYAGHFSEVVWVRPHFAHQLPDGSHKMHVGDCDGRIGVSSSLDYFLSDGSYVSESELENKKQVQLTVTEVHESFNEIVKDRAYVLDIDLDYFSTHNPFIDIYPAADTYAKLKEIFAMEKNYDANDPDSMTAFVDERNRRLEFFDEIFQHMAQHGSLEKYKFSEDASLREKFDLVKELIESLCHHYSIYDIDWLVINNAGCTVDDEEHQLPHHESSEQEITEMMKKFEGFLWCLSKPPEIVTISRSSHDGYCPAHQVEAIQASVIDALRRVFAENLAEQPTLWYKNTSETPALELVEPRVRHNQPHSSTSSSC